MTSATSASFSERRALGDRGASSVTLQPLYGECRHLGLAQKASAVAVSVSTCWYKSHVSTTPPNDLPMSLTAVHSSR